MKKRMFFSIAIIFFLLTVVKPDKVDVCGETFALSEVNTKSFLYQPIRIVRVYRYDETGQIIEYESDKDYEVDYINGTICRTKESGIPDYTDHNVVYNEDGTFSFSSIPRNPELNIEYQILVDYTTVLFPWQVVKPKSGVDRTVAKLKSGEDVKVLLCGDSIAAGAQTTGLYYFDDHVQSTFLGYLDSFIEDCYGVNCDAVLFGEEGVSFQYMMEHLDEIAEEEPDVVMVEFGMNDHIVDGAMSLQDGFKSGLAFCVEMLQNKDIEVILIGFFQQNDKWEKENMEATCVYNTLIEEVATAYKVPFIDIGKKWKSINGRKNMIEDMTSDYMHHPTDFGHKIYFSEIVPYFLNRNMRTIQNYIY